MSGQMKPLINKRCQGQWKEGIADDENFISPKEIKKKIIKETELTTSSKKITEENITDYRLRAQSTFT